MVLPRLRWARLLPEAGGGAAEPGADQLRAAERLPQGLPAHADALLHAAEHDGAVRPAQPVRRRTVYSHRWGASRLFRTSCKLQLARSFRRSSSSAYTSRGGQCHWLIVETDMTVSRIAWWCSRRGQWSPRLYLLQRDAVVESATALSTSSMRSRYSLCNLSWYKADGNVVQARARTST